MKARLYFTDIKSSHKKHKREPARFLLVRHSLGFTQVIPEVLPALRGEHATRLDEALPAMFDSLERSVRAVISFLP